MSGTLDFLLSGGSDVQSRTILQFSVSNNDTSTLKTQTLALPVGITESNSILVVQSFSVVCSLHEYNHQNGVPYFEYVSGGTEIRMSCTLAGQLAGGDARQSIARANIEILEI